MISGMEGSTVSEMQGLETAADMVEHPPHYTAHPSGVECIEIIEAMANPSLAMAVKYLWRQGLKDDAVEDLRKARWYVEREYRRQVELRQTAMFSPDIRSGFAPDIGRAVDLLVSAGSSFVILSWLSDAIFQIDMALARLEAESTDL